MLGVSPCSISRRRECRSLLVGMYWSTCGAEDHCLVPASSDIAHNELEDVFMDKGDGLAQMGQIERLPFPR